MRTAARVFRVLCFASAISAAGTLANEPTACHDQPRTSATARGAARSEQENPAIAVAFDGTAVRELIQWARSDSMELPSAWRSQRPFALTREWARGSGLPDPNSEVEQILKEIIREKPQTAPEARMARTEGFLNNMLEDRQTFLQRAVPHLQAYLSPGTPIRGQVLFAVFIPAYAFAWDGSIVVNLTAAFWKWEPQKVFNLLVHELYHIGFAAHRPDSPAEQVQTRSGLVENVFWQTQNEGMATYVAYRANPPSLEVEDYRLLDDAAEVRLRFEMLRKLLADIQRADELELHKLRDRLWSEGVEKRAFYIVGAWMARQIESRKGRKALVRTVVDGPPAFLDAYMTTSPPPELQLHAPTSNRLSRPAANGADPARDEVKGAGPTAATDNAYGAVVERYRALIPSLMAREKIPGLSIALVDEKDVIWVEGFGYTDRSATTAVTPDTLFSLQSTSKAVTATAIMTAVQRGMLDLDVPVRKYLPGFRINSRFETNPGARITLRHLLSHTAGLTHEAPVGNNFDPRCSSFEEHVGSISNTWLRYPVGERYSYSNLGFDLAGYILQVACGQPFHQCVTQLVLDPLGMTNSSFDVQAVLRRQNRAVGHDDAFPNLAVEIPIKAAGGLYSTARDMAKFLQLLLNDGNTTNGKVLEERLLREMRRIPFPAKGQSEGYAVGVDLARRNGVVFLSHGGGGFGFRSDLIWCPEYGVGIVFLTNSVNHTLQGVLADQILNEVIALLRKGRPDSGKGDQQLESLALRGTKHPERRFVGNYVGRFQDLDIVEATGVIGIRRESKFYPLEFRSSNEAFMRESGKVIFYRFESAKRPRRSYVIRIRDGLTWDYNDGPSDPAGPAKREWGRYVGEYSYKIYGKPMGTYKLHLKNGYLYLDDLRLDEFKPGLFFAANGEALDLRGERPTWRNIQIIKASN